MLIGNIRLHQWAFMVGQNRLNFIVSCFSVVHVLISYFLLFSCRFDPTD